LLILNILSSLRIIFVFIKNDLTLCLYVLSEIESDVFLNGGRYDPS
jgi:hypothetical protein